MAIVLRVLNRMSHCSLSIKNMLVVSSLTLPTKSFDLPVMIIKLKQDRCSLVLCCTGFLDAATLLGLNLWLLN